MLYPSIARHCIFTIALIGLALYGYLGGYFAQDIVVEIAILAILAISLDFLAGFGAMVSLCHAAIMGIAAYTYALIVTHVDIHPLYAMFFALITASLLGLGIGWITAKISGIFFLMATLAFGQMLYTIVYKSRSLGGTDGFGGFDRFLLLGINMHNSLYFTLYALTLVVLVYLLAHYVLCSSFGRSLVGIKVNEARMQAIGVHTHHVRTFAFGFSALLAGFAGVLSAQHTMYITPQLLHWTHSGEALLIVILGGIGTLAGSLLGAITFVFIKHGVSTFTNYWHIYIGIVLICAVLGKQKGVYQYCVYGIHWVRSMSILAKKNTPA